MNRKSHTMRAWVQRRRDKGIEPDADTIWKRIKTNWPTLSEAEAETIFQESN